MAEIRFNYGDKFTQTSDSNTGIGSTIPAGKLDVAGATSAGSLRVSGIASLSSYQGFVNTKLTPPTEGMIVEAGQSGSVSGEVVVGTGQTISVSTGATTGQGGIQSLKVYETFMPPVGGTADRPTSVKPGMVYYNMDFKTIEFWDGNFWKQVDNTTTRGRALLTGGDDLDGGSGLSRLDSTLIFEGLSQGCTSTAAFLSIHNMATWMIDNFGSQELKERFVPDLCSMKKISSYCLTEPGAGSDAGGLRTKAEKSGDHYILNGTKSFISGGGFSDVYVTMVKTDENSISTLVIEKDSEGLSFGGQEKKMGWNSQPTAQVIFEDCKVPVENLIGQEGDGFKIAMMGLDGGRLNIAACSLGTAQSAYERAVQYVGEREQFGKKLQEFQALQFKLADMCTELEASRLILREAAIKVDDNTSDKTKAAAMAKRFVTDAGFNIVNEALQIHGGYGYLKDYPLERNLRDLRVHQILEGTNEIMRVIIAREILKENK